MSTEPTFMRRFLVRLLPLALAATAVAGGWHIYQSAPVDMIVRFEVSPSFRIGDRSVRREALVQLETSVQNAEGEVLVRSSVGLGAGLVSPLSPPLHYHLPRGTYRLIIVLETADRRRLTRVRLLEAQQDGEIRIDL